MTRQARVIHAALLAVSLSAGSLLAEQNPPAGAAARTPRESAPIDLTGYWVSLITEDWRFRMVTPPKGDYTRLPLNPDGRKAADAWDLAADEAAGRACMAYGAAGIMRLPGRLHITWQDDTTLRIETDAGTQTRTLRFAPGATGERTLQGYSTARWDPAARALDVRTTGLTAGYLRRNGVPYSENATLTEHFDMDPYPGGGGQLLVVTTIVDDPTYLQRSFVTSSHFKKEQDGSKWSPTPCLARW